VLDVEKSGRVLGHRAAQSDDIVKNRPFRLPAVIDLIVAESNFDRWTVSARRSSPSPCLVVSV
jgi:hypothetical protein